MLTRRIMWMMPVMLVMVLTTLTWMIHTTKGHAKFSRTIALCYYYKLTENIDIDLDSAEHIIIASGEGCTLSLHVH